jgi:hypothetical protein
LVIRPDELSPAGCYERLLKPPVRLVTPTANREATAAWTLG